MLRNNTSIDIFPQKMFEIHPPVILLIYYQNFIFSLYIIGYTIVHTLLDFTTVLETFYLPNLVFLYTHCFIS